MTKSLKNLWDLLLFRDRGVLPTKRFLTLFILVSIGLITVSFTEVKWLLIVVVNGLFLIVSLFDLFLSPRAKQLSFTREISQEIERDSCEKITITVTNTSSKPFHFILIDDLPQSFTNNLPIQGEVGGKETRTFSYEILAPIRGDYILEKLYIRYKSHLGLWAKQRVFKDQAKIKVIPDLTDVRAFLQEAQKYLLYEGMTIKRHQVGMGEFASIRLYVVGDDPRLINWHQTAKLQEVMTNVYEPEHGKYITILIDCGRWMGVELSKANRLERTLEAALTLAAAALKRGDYVSVIAFSKKVHAFIPPAKGFEHLQTILKELYNLQVHSVESSYQQAFNFVELNIKKRSLLFVFSDVQTLLYNDYLLEQLERIRRKHLFLLLGIQDERLQTITRKRPEYVEKAMIKSMAQYQVLMKKREKHRWEKRGLHFVEAKEEGLTAAAISTYFDFMNRGLL